MSLRRIETSSGMQACEGKTNLETAVEFLLRPRRRGLSLLDHWLRPIPAKMAPFIIGADRGVLNEIGWFRQLRPQAYNYNAEGRGTDCLGLRASRRVVRLRNFVRKRLILLPSRTDCPNAS